MARLARSTNVAMWRPRPDSRERPRVKASVLPADREARFVDGLSSGKVFMVVIVEPLLKLRLTMWRSGHRNSRGLAVAAHKRGIEAVGLISLRVICIRRPVPGLKIFR